MTDELASDLGRFAEPALLVLTSLASGAKHGYAIMGDIASFSGAVIGPGTLYAVLARLERRGLIEPLPEDERRRPYRLTTAGEQSLESQLNEIRHFASVGLARLDGSPG